MENTPNIYLGIIFKYFNSSTNWQFVIKDTLKFRIRIAKLPNFLLMKPGI